MSTTRTTRIRKEFLLSGWCNLANPPSSHERCAGGQSANADKEFQGCPCQCHLGETFECGGCGEDIREAPMMLRLWGERDPEGNLIDDMVYTHIDLADGRAVGEECNG